MTVCAAVLCLSVCRSARLYVTSPYCIKTTGRIELFWHGNFLPSVLHCTCYREIRVPVKIRVGLPPSDTLHQTIDSENVATSHDTSIVLSAKLVNKFVDHTCDGRRAVAISYTSADHALGLTALLRFLVDLLYNLFSPPGFKEAEGGLLCFAGVSKTIQLSTCRLNAFRAHTHPLQ